MVKHAAGVLLQAPAPSSRAGQRQQQVYRTIVDAVASGRLAAGARLPSARRLAEDWAVARGVVDEAYARLQDEGVIVRRIGDGSYVAWTLPHSLERRAPASNELPTRCPPAVSPGPVPSPPLALDPCRLPVEAFPLATWRRMVARSLADPQRSLLEAAPAAGLPALREAIARHVALAHSLPCGADQVLVLDSRARGVELVVRALLAPGDPVWIGEPGPPQRRQVLQWLQQLPLTLPDDPAGIATGAAGQPGAEVRLAWLHPHSACARGPQATALLDWAVEQVAWILEDDADHEGLHLGPPPPALAARDRHRRVLLLGGFDLLLGPALRIAYMVVPPGLVAPLAGRLQQLGDPPPGPSQRALAWFLDEGHWATHCRRLRRLVSERRSALLQAARQHLRDARGGPLPVRWSPLDAGLQACLHLPPQWPAARVQQSLQPLGVGALALPPASGINALWLGYGACPAAELDAGMAALGAVLRSLQPVSRSIDEQAPSA